MQVYARDLMALMDGWAPPQLAESWDNPGLQAGDPDQKVGAVMVALDVTRENVGYAKTHGIDMIISHHPFLFKAMKRIDTGTEKGAILRDLLAHGISAFAAHTNLDTADGGVNDALAEALDLRNCRGLVPVREHRRCKLAVYVPREKAQAVRDALAKAGAGSLGGYSGCSFSADGTGHFCGGSGTHPYIGRAGEETAAEEVRIETFFTPEIRERVISAMLAAHPYEEPVYELYALENGSRWDMMGRIGELPQPMRGEEALAYIQERLGIPVLKYAGKSGADVRRVAVLGGAGAEFAPLARKAGADLYLTGDVKYHEAQDAAASGLILADGGHFYTERVVIPVLAERIRRSAVKKGWDLQVTEDPTARDIFQYL